MSIYACVKPLFLFFFSAPRFRNKVFHCLPDSGHAQRLVWQNEEREVLSPGNDVRGWTRAFAERKKEEWETVSPWMALVNTMLQQKRCLETEECDFETKSVLHQCVRFKVYIYVLTGLCSCRLWQEVENRCFRWRTWRALSVTGLWGERPELALRNGQQIKNLDTDFKMAMSFYAVREDASSITKIKNYL